MILVVALFQTHCFVYCCYQLLFMNVYQWIMSNILGTIVFISH